eukprot:snap_masked-scaffold_10-processed-gene-9.23-mRNA-1 protein AED:1.00 eAED:1.00 QI:0/0/0/0/1/1/2/0/121
MKHPSEWLRGSPRKTCSVERYVPSKIVLAKFVWQHWYDLYDKQVDKLSNVGECSFIPKQSFQKLAEILDLVEPFSKNMMASINKQYRKYTSPRMANSYSRFIQDTPPSQIMRPLKYSSTKI